MTNAYHSQSTLSKPDILQTVARYGVELRRAGRQWHGLCPFHAEKTPSFAVDADKGVFYCHGCHVGGDVIRFVELAEKTDFKGALKILGIDGTAYKPKPRDLLKERGAAMVAKWMNEQHGKAGAMLRELSRSIAIAEEIGASTLLERWGREFAVLETFFDDLQDAQFAGELFAAKASIEAITARAPIEPLMKFPPWTPEYAAYLESLLPEDA